MSIDLRAVLRRYKPERQLGQLKPRPINRLMSALDARSAGVRSLVVDTNYYIRRAAGTLSSDATALADAALTYHCAVSLGELATGIGNADPAHPNWPATRDHYAGLVASIATNRILTPDPGTWIAAGLIAGTLARTQNYQPQQRKECLYDALIYLTASRAGLPVLTADRGDFDLIQQVAGEGAFIHF